MNQQKAIEGLVALGNYLREHRENDLARIKIKAKVQNPWFTEENINYCLDTWSETLTQEAISNWVKSYAFNDNAKTIGLIPAGNIPLVGLHDLLSVLVAHIPTQQYIDPARTT